MAICIYICQGKSLNPYNFLKSSKCLAFSKLQTRRLLNIAIGEITVKRKAERKIEETTRYQTMIIDPLLLCSGSCTLIQPARTRMFSDRCYPAVPNEGWRKVEVLPHANCARFHPPLLVPIFLASRGGNGKPSKYLGAYLPARVRWKETRFGKYKRQKRDRREMSKG